MLSFVKNKIKKAFMSYKRNPNVKHLNTDKINVYFKNFLLKIF